MTSNQFKLTRVGLRLLGTILPVIVCIIIFCFLLTNTKVCAQSPEFVRGEQFATNSYQETTGILTDAAGAIYTTGFFSGTANFKPAEGGAFIKTSNGLSDIFIIKTNSLGETVWLKTIGGTDEDRVNSFSIINDKIILTGSFYDTVDFNPGLGENIIISKGGEDIFMLTLDLSGNYQSSFSIGGVHHDAALGIVTDTLENFYLCGYFSDEVDFDLGAQSQIKISAGLKDMFIAKYNSSGFLGYVQTFGSVGNEQLKAIAVNADNTVIAAGIFNSTFSVNTETGVQVLDSEGSTDVFVTSIRPDGFVKNVSSFGGKKNDDVASVITDDEDNIYICGSFADTVIFNGQVNTQEKIAKGASDLYFLKLNNLGEYINVLTAGSKLTDNPTSIIVGGKKEIIAVGFFQDTLVFETQSGIFNAVSKGLADPFLIKMDSLANFKWVGNAGSSDNDVFTNLFIDNDNQIFTTGFSGSQFTADLSGNTNILSGNAPYNILQLQYNNCLAASQPTIVAPPGGICSTEQIVLRLTDNYLNSAEYWEWYSGDCNGTIIGTGDSIIIQQNATTTYYVKGVGGCAGTSECGSATVVLSGCFSVSADIDSVNCIGGSVKLQALTENGQAPYTYSIDNINFSSQSLFNVVAGTYTVYAKDAIGRTASSGPYVVTPACFSVSALADTAGCFIDTTTLYAITQNGEAPFMYSIDNMNFFSEPSFNVTAGTYIVYAQDAIGRTASSGPYEVMPVCFGVSAVIDSVSCIGGSVKLGLITENGVAPFTYSIDNINFSSQSLFNVVAGTYTVYAKDAIGRTASAGPYVVKPACFGVSVLADSVACFGGTTTLNAITQNGMAPFTYSLDNINFISVPNFNVTAGTYTVYARDAEGRNTMSVPFTVLQPTKLRIIGVCYSPVEKYLGLQAAGGTKPYQFSRNGTTYFNGIQRSGTAYVFVNAFTNIYTLRVKDSKGCEIALQVRTDTLPVCPAARPAVFARDKTTGNNQKIAELNAIVKPNPSASYFEIDLKGNSQKKITVSDARGIIVFSKETKETKISTGENWLPGLYILQITENNISKQYKLIKL